MKKIDNNGRRRPSGPATGLRFKTARNVMSICIFSGVFCSLLYAPGIIAAEAQQAQLEKIKNTQTAIEKWVDTERIISKEKKDFTLKKEILNERIELTRREIDSLKNKIAEAEDSIAEADKKRVDMIAENEKLKTATASLQDTLVMLEDRTKQLLGRLPDPIRDRVKPLSQRLPDDPDETQLSISERFQNVVGILNEVDKFNREIVVNSEVRTLQDGSSVQVTALYVGIGQGYYANESGTIAGIGTATPDGWVWKPSNEAAPQIAEAIAIFNNEKVATFVQVPVDIQ